MTLRSAAVLLSEVTVALRKLTETGETTTLFLSQFPMSEPDADALHETLGEGGVIIQSHSHELTVWRSAAVPGVWWGEYYGGRIITVRTLEIARVPDLVGAQPQDLRDGLHKLEMMHHA